MGMIAYTVSAFLLSAAGLMSTTNARIAEFYTVALFTTGMAVVVLILFAAE